jgi:hypothetical protein
MGSLVYGAKAGMVVRGRRKTRTRRTTARFSGLAPLLLELNNGRVNSADRGALAACTTAPRVKLRTAKSLSEDFNE